MTKENLVRIIGLLVLLGVTAVAIASLIHEFTGGSPIESSVPHLLG